ncbi:hypothetical protein JG688_00011559 [Phytophthora aleatoria]|uniref:Uncharacterized protein n=1 Tax=Phytophthora aleatoria TaxID=2496075 RepID=A0A8J5IGM1_9STRA|nr:hypothetical protein JG688_00011559 [Phytophthora aleatoria]
MTRTKSSMAMLGSPLLQRTKRAPTRTLRVSPARSAWGLEAWLDFGIMKSSQQLAFHVKKCWYSS